jgi:hypothetical protein
LQQPWKTVDTSFSARYTAAVLKVRHYHPKARRTSRAKTAPITIYVSRMLYSKQANMRIVTLTNTERERVSMVFIGVRPRSSASDFHLR